MSSKKGNLDIDPDEFGTYLVQCQNKLKLKYHKLMNTFGSFGTVSSLYDEGNKISVRYLKKMSALTCYYTLYNDISFLPTLPHKVAPKDEEFSTTGPNKEFSRKNEPVSMGEFYCRYECKKRKFIYSEIFRGFLSSIHSLNSNMKDPQFISVFKWLSVSTERYIDRGDWNEVDLPEKNVTFNACALISAKDSFYLHSLKVVTPIDVLVCNFPPWYNQCDILRLIGRMYGGNDEIVQADWLRFNPVASDDIVYPFCLVHFKTLEAASEVCRRIDGIVLENDQRLNACLMDDVETKLLEVNEEVPANENF